MTEELNTILTTLAGSHAHGINTPASDFDYLSVFMAPLEGTLGIRPFRETIVTRSAPNGVRSSAGDVEHTFYELRHFLKLATQGNPNILVPLYCSERDVEHQTRAGQELRALAPFIVSMQAVHRHLGYLDAQYGRMRGNGPHQARKPNRPELIEAHGYDTKYAAHALRLGWQGVELARSGGLTLPLPPEQRDILLRVRQGDISEGGVSGLIETAREELKAYVNGDNRSPLRQYPDYSEVNRWLVTVQVGEPWTP